MSNERKLNAKEALALVRKEFPKLRAVGGCSEYEKFFVFGLVGKDAKPRKSGRYFGTGVKVNRLTGEVSHFFPPEDGWENFRNGKTLNLDEIM